MSNPEPRRHNLLLQRLRGVVCGAVLVMVVVNASVKTGDFQAPSEKSWAELAFMVAVSIFLFFEGGRRAR